MYGDRKRRVETMPHRRRPTPVPRAAGTAKMQGKALRAVHLQTHREARRRADSSGAVWRSACLV